MADEQFIGRKLYYVKDIFLLIIGSEVFEVNEPVGWDKILMSLSFDKTIKGFKFEFSDKDVTLQFDLASGFQKLKDLYYANGIDAQAGFKFGEIDSNTNVVTIWYEARLDFSTYFEDLFTIKLQLERQSLVTKFMARRQVDFELEKTETLGGGLKNLPQLTTYKSFLHPPFINSKATFNYNSNIDVSDVTFQDELITGAVVSSTTVPPIRSISNEIENFEEPLAPAGELFYTGLHLPNGVVKKNISIKGTVAFKVTYARLPLGGVTAKFGLKIYKKLGISTGVDDNAFNDLPNTFVYYDQFIIVNSTNNVFTPAQFDFDLVTELLDDEALFIKAYKVVTHPAGPNLSPIVWDKTNLWDTRVSSYDFIRPAVYPAYKIKDVLERMFKMVTDTNGTFKSDFFTTGLGRDHFLNSGKQLRSIPAAPLVTSFKSVLPSCDMLWNMGGSFERGNSGGEWFRYEPMEYFFRDVELIKLDVISKYTKSPALENIFNELEFGFKKYPQGNEAGSALDFMTKFNFLTNIQNYQQKLSRICEFLLSPYYISYAIANSFEVNQTKQFDTDNDIFLISHRDTVQNSFSGQVVFSSAGNKMFIQVGVPIVKGEVINISGTVLNNGNKVVKDIVWDNLNGSVRTVIYIDSLLISETAGAAAITFSPKWIPKRDEQFTSTEGVDSPQTVYNLQHHIKIVFKRWAKFFLSGIVYTKDDPTDQTVIKYMSSSNNRLVNTTLSALESQTPMSPVFRAANPTSPDIDRTDERAADLEYPIFGRSLINLEAPMTWQLLDRLRKAFEGRDPEDKNYGYFSILNPYGIYEKGYLIDLRFEPNQQNAKIQLIEKYNG